MFGTPVVIWTVIGATMVTLAVVLTLANPAPVAAEVAVMTTTGLGVGLGSGTVGGAVKVAGAPLAVRDGDTEPQGVLAQLTDQVTPELVRSFETTAMTVAVAFVNIVLGGA